MISGLTPGSRTRDMGGMMVRSFAMPPNRASAFCITSVASTLPATTRSMDWGWYQREM